jgi:hypothetical protein
VNKIESEGQKRQGRQVTANGSSSPWTGRKRLERYACAHAGEGKNSASPIDMVVFDLDECSGGSSREGDRSKRRECRVDISAR